MYRRAAPIPGPDAFSAEGEAAQLSQAAFLLATSLILTGDGDRLDGDRRFPLPDRRRLQASGPIDYERIVSTLDIDLATHRAKRSPRLVHDRGPQLAVRAAEADTEAACALIEASTHSDAPVVRAAAAAAAVITSGARDDLVHELVEGIGSEDELARDISATALANVRADHPRLLELAVEIEPDGDPRPRSNTAFVTHGTWASNADWYQAGSDFIQHLATTDLAPIHDPPFKWSGAYNHAARVAAATRMVEWVENQGLDTPDVVGHSHGGTVANLATQLGLEVDRLVLLSWPVHRAWYPAFANVQRIISFRVRFDLVIMADRGGQRFRHPAVEEHRNGWFDHGATHEADYWQEHDLARHL